MRQFFFAALVFSALSVNVNADLIPTPFTMDFNDTTKLREQAQEGKYYFNTASDYYGFALSGIQVDDPAYAMPGTGGVLGAIEGSLLGVNYGNISNDYETSTTPHFRRTDNTTFQFLGGYLTPRNYTDGQIDIIGYIGDQEYVQRIDISLSDDSPIYYEYQYADLELDRLHFKAVFDSFTGFLDIKYPDRWLVESKPNAHLFVFDNLNFIVKQEASPTPEPGTMLIFGIAALTGMPVYRMMRKNRRV